MADRSKKRKAKLRVKNYLTYFELNWRHKRRIWIRTFPFGESPEELPESVSGLTFPLSPILLLLASLSLLLFVLYMLVNLLFFIDKNRTIQTNLRLNQKMFVLGIYLNKNFVYKIKSRMKIRKINLVHGQVQLTIEQLLRWALGQLHTVTRRAHRQTSTYTRFWENWRKIACCGLWLQNDRDALVDRSWRVPFGTRARRAAILPLWKRWVCISIIFF